MKRVGSIRLLSRLLVWPLLVLAPAARAALPPTPPPLPTPAWRAAAQMIARHEVPPLPDGEQADAPTGWTANPFSATQDTPADPADERQAAPPSTNGADAVPTAVPAAAPEPLEGPPVPLPAPSRLADTASGSDGLPPDRPISLNFQRAELTAVLHAFAQFTRLNIVASERVRGQITLRLDRVPWRAAFDLLLESNGLAMERHGGVLWVAPAADLAARERLRFEAHARAAELEPLASRAFELHYARAEDLRRLLSGSGTQRALSKRGAAVADARTNLLFVTDLAGRLDQIADLIRRLDAPARQVLIEARIVEGDEGLSRELGVRLGVTPNAVEGTARGVRGSAADGTLYDLGAGAINGFAAAQLGLTLLAARATRLLDIELSALEAQGRGRVVSSPRVVTADRTKAVVEQGTELPYQAKVGQGVSGVQFRRASLKLEVEPQITPDGRVILDLDVAKDSVGEQTAAGPAINTKHVQTRVEIEDGGTVSIGGIDATDDRDDVTRVPLLGKIPLLGALFSHRAHWDKRSELVVFITPRVVTGD
ncbi:type IV pilus assembly protein PilQ [Paraburkholderia tropica]|uniref:type IV pilus secretin PilQ n=1 Tax=Paraburkholderia tropica TaxID=92647 RepID=UPI0016206329|nr:type IV pilus secretin PilQ [Paraburkholderia tropica]MBB3003667.1 type IV pilus assembly protein PilQ [Paraburkholderia tropica]MBB6323001.1 type IV pilus assembly protein PilQ [Paraburkholderia tropica]